MTVIRAQPFLVGAAGPLSLFQNRMQLAMYTPMTTSVTISVVVPLPLSMVSSLDDCLRMPDGCRPL